MMATKTCVECKVEKELTEFSFVNKHDEYRRGACKSCTSVRSMAYYIRIKREVIDFYGAKCACCGETEYKFLTLDHVNNDGAADRRALAKPGSPYSRASNSRVYRDLVRSGFSDAARFQILCFNCNSGRQYNGGVCPHRDLPAETLD